MLLGAHNAVRTRVKRRLTVYQKLVQMMAVVKLDLDRPGPIGLPLHWM